MQARTRIDMKSAAATVVGIGWDAGGWLGANHGLAACEWNRASGELRWLGRPSAVRLGGELLAFDRLWALAAGSSELPPDAAAIVIGVDAPLGFPDGFVRLLSGDADAVPQPLPDKEIASPLAYRYTDRYIYETFGKKPLSAAFDRIGNNATVALAHTRKWETESGFVRLPASEPSAGAAEAGAGGPLRAIVEVYPARRTALRCPDSSLRLRTTGRSCGRKGGSTTSRHHGVRNKPSA